MDASNTFQNVPSTSTTKGEGEDLDSQTPLSVPEGKENLPTTNAATSDEATDNTQSSNIAIGSTTPRNVASVSTATRSTPNRSSATAESHEAPRTPDGDPFGCLTSGHRNQAHETNEKTLENEFYRDIELPRQNIEVRDHQVETDTRRQQRQITTSGFDQTEDGSDTQRWTAATERDMHEQHKQQQNRVAGLQQVVNEEAARSTDMALPGPIVTQVENPRNLGAQVRDGQLAIVPGAFPATTIVTARPLLHIGNEIDEPVARSELSTIHRIGIRNSLDRRLATVTKDEAQQESLREEPFEHDATRREGKGNVQFLLPTGEQPANPTLPARDLSPSEDEALDQPASSQPSTSRKYKIGDKVGNTVIRCEADIRRVEASDRRDEARTVEARERVEERIPTTEHVEQSPSTEKEAPQESSKGNQKQTFEPIKSGEGRRQTEVGESSRIPFLKHATSMSTFFGKPKLKREHANHIKVPEGSASRGEKFKPSFKKIIRLGSRTKVADEEANPVKGMKGQGQQHASSVPPKIPNRRNWLGGSPEEAHKIGERWSRDVAKQKIEEESDFEEEEVKPRQLPTVAHATTTGSHSELFRHIINSDYDPMSEDRDDQSRQAHESTVKDGKNECVSKKKKKKPRSSSAAAARSHSELFRHIIDSDYEIDPEDGEIGATDSHSAGSGPISDSNQEHRIRGDDAQHGDIQGGERDFYETYRLFHQDANEQRGNEPESTTPLPPNGKKKAEDKGKP